MLAEPFSKSFIKNFVAWISCCDHVNDHYKNEKTDSSNPAFVRHVSIYSSDKLRLSVSFYRSPSRDNVRSIGLHLCDNEKNKAGRRRGLLTFGEGNQRTILSEHLKK